MESCSIKNRVRHPDRCSLRFRAGGDVRMDYRLNPLLCATTGEFTFRHEFVRVFLAILPRNFQATPTVLTASTGIVTAVRQPDGSWRDLGDAFPMRKTRVPDVCTMAGLEPRSQTSRSFVYDGRTHPSGMRRLQGAA